MDLKDPADLRPNTTVIWQDTAGERPRAFSAIASEEQAVRREMQEETGLEVRVERQFLRDPALGKGLAKVVRYTLVVVAFFFLLTFVVPKFTAFYAQSGVDLPLRWVHGEALITEPLPSLTRHAISSAAFDAQ